MGRPRRIQFPGACYYIVLNGNNKQDIFLSSQDRRQFLSLLRLFKERYEFKVYAYCLMSADAHLLLETREANLSTVMQGLLTSYTKYFNGAHSTVGHVFQGRFRSLLVDKDQFLFEMSRYVHLHPARAGMREKPWRYQWSSCAAYIESETAEPLVDSGAVLSRFARPRLQQSVRYLQALKDRLKSASDYVLPVSGGLVVGSEAFLARVRGAPATAAPARPQLAEDARRILAQVASRHGLSEEKLVGPLQWRDVSSVRRQAIYEIWKATRLGVTEISRLFNRTPSAVSQVIRAMETADR